MWKYLVVILSLSFVACGIEGTHKPPPKDSTNEVALITGLYYIGGIIAESNSPFYWAGSEIDASWEIYHMVNERTENVTYTLKTFKSWESGMHGESNGTDIVFEDYESVFVEELGCMYDYKVDFLMTPDKTQDGFDGKITIKDRWCVMLDDDGNETGEVGVEFDTIIAMYGDVAWLPYEKE